MKKAYALFMIPLLPIAILIDILIGDIVTGVKTSTMQKINQHKSQWLGLWNSKEVADE